MVLDVVFSLPFRGAGEALECCVPDIEGTCSLGEVDYMDNP